MRVGQTAACLPRGAIRRCLFFVLLLWGLFAAWTPNAYGHAAFLESTPAPGQRVEAGPRQIVLKFTEPLIRPLSKATLVNASTGKSVAARSEAIGARRGIVIRPGSTLGKAPYRIEWRTVSPVDGHALEGSFGFGVRTAAIGGEQQIEQSPLARGGWLRIVLRWVLYASLLFFAGGVFCAALLSKRTEPAGWLVPQRLRPDLERAGRDGRAMAEKAWSLTIDAGWLAVGSAIAVALVESADAGAGLSLQGLNDFLLSNDAGLARVATVAAVSLAVLVADRSSSTAAGLSALAFLSIAFSGHANSGDPRAIALLTDWTHLLAAAVWVGGIAQIAAVWLPAVRGATRELRSAVMTAVLDRFGTVALPAFLIVAATGLSNALIQLGHPEALWQTTYGRVLGLKITLVALIAVASYWHALRIRPRLVTANPHPPKRLERRHWRLLFAEPLLAVAVAAVAATLVAFPLPPRQSGETGAEARAQAACDPCPLPRPRADQLAVAEQAGSRVAAFWLRRAGSRVSGTVRLLDSNGRPVDAPVRLLGDELEACGLGCWRFGPIRREGFVAVTVEEKGRQYRASVPARWHTGRSAEARGLLERAQRAMRQLRSLKEDERVTSGPRSYARVVYRLKAPDRFAYRTNGDARSIVIGRRQWLSAEGQPWRQEQFGSGIPFRTRTWFRWTPYARAARLLQVRREGGRQLAELALFDSATPVWYRLTVDLRTMRVLKDRMVTKAHFMDRRYLAFNRPVAVRRPPMGAPRR